MKLVFVGMSGIGKSYWARRLESEAGFLKVSCDVEIEAALRHRYSDFPKSGSGEDATAPLAQWMRNPSEPGYERRAAEYLEVEGTVTLKALERIESHSGPAVLDTTGSVIYLAKDIQDELKKRCTIVLLEHTTKDVELLYQTFIKCPKPLIWGDAYEPLPGETVNESLGRCFKALLAFRESQYRKLATVTIPVSKHRSSELSTKEFLTLVNRP